VSAGGETKYTIKVDSSGAVRDTKASQMAFDALEKSLAQVVDRISGQGATHQLLLLEKAVNKAGGTSKLTASGVAHLRKEVQQLADQGGKVPASLDAMNARLAKSDGFLLKVASSAKAMAASMAVGATLAAGAAVAATIGLGVEALEQSVVAAVSYESAFAGVRKTVDASEVEFQVLSDGIRDMSKEMPLAATEIAKVTEAAGQLGIKNENLLQFTETMSKLGFTTNLSAEEAATSLARFNNIVTEGKDEFDRLGSTIVALGNNSATTESEIVAMGLRLAGAGEQVGLTRAEILALATTLSSVGIEAEAGGSAMSRVMIDIAQAVSNGSKAVEGYARVARMSAADFAKAWKDDAAGALVAFIGGLGKMKAEGGNVLGTLEALGITEVRMRDALLRSSAASDVLVSSLQIANTAWTENNALNAEAEQRIRTTEAQWQILKNSVTDVAIETGEALLPAVQAAIEEMGELLPYLERLSQVVIDNKDDIADLTRDGFSYLGDILRATEVSIRAFDNMMTALTENPVARWIAQQVEEFYALEVATRALGDMLEQAVMGPIGDLRQIGRDISRNAPDPKARHGVSGEAPTLPDIAMPTASELAAEAKALAGGKGGGFPLPPSEKDLKEAERRQKQYLRDLERFEKDVAKAAQKAEEAMLKALFEEENEAKAAGAAELERMTSFGNEGVELGGGFFADPQVLREAAEAEERIYQIALAADEAAAAEARAAANAAMWFAVFDASGALLGTIDAGLERIGVSADSAGRRVLGLAQAGAGFAQAWVSGDLLGIISQGFEIAGQIKDIFDKPEFERIAEDVGRRFGTDISESLAKEIEAREAEGDVGRHMAELLSLGDIMGESDRDAREFGDQIGDLLNAIALGAVPAGEGIDELGEAFTKVAEAALEAGSVGDRALRDIMRRSRELGIDSPEIEAFRDKSLTSAAAGVGGGITNIDIVDEADAAAQAQILSSTFWAMFEEVGIVEAGDAFRETFAHLNDQLAELGFEPPAALAGIGDILNLTETDAEFRRAVEGAEAYRQALEGVANADMLTREGFDAFAQQAQAAIDQAQAGGATQEQAYRGVAPLLQSLVEAARNYGYELTEAEKAMIAQAEEAGVSFPVDPIDRAAMAMERLVEVIARAAGVTLDFGDALGDIDSRVPSGVNLPEPRYTDPTIPSVGNLPSHGTGAVVMDEEIARIGEVPEAVVPLQDLFGRFSQQVAADVSALGAGGISGGLDRLTVQVMTPDRRVLAETHMEDLRSNAFGLASQTKRHTGRGLGRG
jgi:TP901 family phage tail tape measure protein